MLGLLNRREGLGRILRCRAAGVAVTNYGLAIAYSLGILERALAPFPEALEAVRRKRPVPGSSRGGILTMPAPGRNPERGTWAPCTGRNSFCANGIPRGWRRSGPPRTTCGGRTSATRCTCGG
jgi:hypothetical protein